VFVVFVLYIGFIYQSSVCVFEKVFVATKTNCFIVCLNERKNKSKAQISIFFPAFPGVSCGIRRFFLLMNILNFEIHLSPPPGFAVFETLPAGFPKV